VLKNKPGILVDTSGDVVVVDAATWKVRYTPDTSDFNADNSPYYARFIVTDGSGNQVPIPRRSSGLWTKSFF
jgi:hypothetical protein